MTDPQSPSPRDALHANLLALSEVQPELCERLHWPVDGDHLTRSPDGNHVLRYRGAQLDPELGDDSIDNALAGLDPDSSAPVLLFALGLGELLTALLERNGHQEVVAWESDPWMLRQALTLHDWSDELRSGRLALALNADLASFTGTGSKFQLLPHPLLARLYPDELEIRNGRPATKRAMVCRGTLFVDSLSNSLRSRGYSVLTLDVQRISADESKLAVQTWKPELMASINCTDGLAEFCESMGVPNLCWEIDPALNGPDPLQGPAPGAFVFTYREASVPHFEGAGFQNVTYLPLAADPAKRKPLELSAAETERFGAPVSFVGASLMGNVDSFKRAFAGALQGWSGDSPEQCVRVLSGVLEQQRQDFSTYRIPELLDQACPGFRDHCQSAGSTDPALLLAELAAAEKRLTYVASLAPSGMVAWGDRGWAQLQGRGVRYMGSALHETELPRIYNASTINVDVGRIYQDDIVTMRIFDILACGGFVLAEHSDALAALFEIGVEVESYSNLANLQAKVAHYLAHPDQAQAIAARGRQAVLERHTIDQRVEQMLQAMARIDSQQAA